MELRHINYFVVLAEELHFRKAAERLNMSQPPLSQQIQALEKEFGVLLFERDKRKVKLTKEGEVILKEAYQLLESSQRLRDVVSKARKGNVGILSVGCIPTAFPEVLPPILKSFQEQDADIQLSIHELNSADILSKVKAQELDVGFARVNEVEAPLESYPIQQDRFVVVLKEDHPLAAKNIISLKMLANEPFIIIKRQVSPQFYDSVLPACQKAGFYPVIAQEGSSIQSQIGFVSCGFGIALLPSAAKKIYQSGIVYRNLKETIPITEISLVWNSKSKSNILKHFVGTSTKLFHANK